VSLRAIGLLDYIGRSDTVVIIEWAERVPEILPKDVLKIGFAHGKEDWRTINLPKRLEA
jgi:tRNA A37 threonylcarbamoyladenosine biosynthesis protein TsaE